MQNTWVLHQYNDKYHKFFTTTSYDDIMQYISSFENVKYVEEFHYISNDIHFKIHIGEVLYYGKQDLS